jgi:hypothetical protein
VAKRQQVRAGLQSRPYKGEIMGDLDRLIQSKGFFDLVNAVVENKMRRYDKHEIYDTEYLSILKGRINRFLEIEERRSGRDRKTIIKHLEILWNIETI